MEAVQDAAAGGKEGDKRPPPPPGRRGTRSIGGARKLHRSGGGEVAKKS